MNLIAVSGAIFKTFIPFPLHSEATPPSIIICLKPPSRLIRLVFEEWTCSAKMCFKWDTVTDICSSVHLVYFWHISLPAWGPSFGPAGPYQCGKRTPPLHLQQAASASRRCSSLPPWIHPGWRDCRLCPEPSDYIRTEFKNPGTSDLQSRGKTFYTDYLFMLCPTLLRSSSPLHQALVQICCLWICCEL